MNHWEVCGGGARGGGAVGGGSTIPTRRRSSRPMASLYTQVVVSSPEVTRSQGRPPPPHFHPAPHCRRHRTALCVLVRQINSLRHRCPPRSETISGRVASPASLAPRSPLKGQRIKSPSAGQTSGQRRHSSDTQRERYLVDSQPQCERRGDEGGGVTTSR